MAATAICNSVPHPQREAREKLYMQCAEKYSAAELETFAKMLAEITLGLEANSQQDFLGELFMALDLGNRMARAVFYTLQRMQFNGGNDVNGKRFR